QFYAAPLTLNPALTGNFNGLYRITGIYRNQWPGLTNSKPAFSTPSVGADLSLLREKLKGRGALGVGLVFLNDQQNGKTFNNNEIMASVAYNMIFGKKKEFQLGVGLQGGVLMTKADLTQLKFGDEAQIDQLGAVTFNQAMLDESLNTGQKVKGLFNIGIFAKYDFYKGMRVYLGYAFNNATHYKEDYILNSITTYNEPFRSTLHGGFEFEIKDKAVLIPGFLFQHTNVSDAETEFGLTAGIHVVKSPDEMKRATLYIGLWDRLNYKNSTIIPKIGFEYHGFRAGFAYDAALLQQRADASNIGGGMAQAFEITLSFIGDIRIPKEDHYLFNPIY
ncbi:MAG TPA: PorP/SprF family type IX secretion system membrane protein, partial [Chitinophagales bacterium]|nr:PorP/SprF family type IX secretion system membrane protein [Chitinophagales bacterium]